MTPTAQTPKWNAACRKHCALGDPKAPSPRGRACSVTNQLTASAAGVTQIVETSGRNAVHEAEIQAAVDRHIEMERKAAAWDAWRTLVGRSGPNTVWGEGMRLVEVLDALERPVHPAQEPSKS